MTRHKIHFDWDPSKDATNCRKHGVSFDEAQTAFYDDAALLLDDPDHSEDESRFLLLGFSRSLRLLIVCHCYRDQERIIRIISARKAEASERRQYSERSKS